MKAWERWVKALGQPPECLGWYELGDEQCDGVPCRWRTGCSAYTARCQQLGVNPREEITMLGELEPLYPLIYKLLTTDPHRRKDRQLHRMAWQRFLQVLTEYLPPDRVIVPTQAVARLGDLYVSQAWKSRERGSSSFDGTGYAATLPSFWSINLLAQRAYPLVRFWPRPFSVIEPTVQLRCSLNALLARWPQTADTCRRMKADAHRERWRRAPKMPTKLVRVLPERLDDVARLCGTAIRERFLDVPDRAWRL